MTARSLIIQSAIQPVFNHQRLLHEIENDNKSLACENIRFSSLFAAGDVSRGGTSATQRQKFHTDDANQCLHNKSSSHGVPNINCLILRVFCSILVNSNACSREDYIPQILTVLLEIHRVHI